VLALVPEVLALVDEVLAEELGLCFFFERTSSSSELLLSLLGVGF
jgi:hypothetical protein